MEHVHLISTERLGRVEGCIRVPDDRVEEKARARTPGHAGTEGGADECPVRELDLDPANEPPQLLRDRGRRIDVGLGHDDHELLTTEAPYDVDPTDALLERDGNPVEDEVAGRVAVRVIHALEVVDVDHGDREFASVAIRPLDLFREPSEERLAVGNTGELVLSGQGPGLRIPPGEPLETSAQARVVKPPARGEFGRICPGRESFGQLADEADLPAEDGHGEAGGAGQGADRQHDDHGDEKLDRERQAERQVQRYGSPDIHEFARLTPRHGLRPVQSVT